MASNNKNVNRDRFVRIAERRVNKILDDYDALGRCSNKKIMNILRMTF